MSEVENYSDSDDRPDLRPFHEPFPWPLLLVAVVVAGAVLGYVYYVYEVSADASRSLPALAAPPADTLAARRGESPPPRAGKTHR